MAANRYGIWGYSPPFVDASTENALPEVGQDRLLDLLGSITGRSLGFASALQPRGEQSLLSLLDALDPAQDVSRARTRASALLGLGAEKGRTAAGMLRRRGFGESVAAGAELDARNQASARAQDSLLEKLSPESRARRLSAMYQAASWPQSPSTLGSRFQAYGLEGQRRALDSQTGGSGLFGGLLDILGVAGPYLLGGRG